MIMPEVGPADNGVVYGSAKEANMMAEFFRPDMPADRMMGVVADKLRSHSKAMRSSHPILSFAGINAEAALESQTMAEPLNPIGVLHEQNGWVLLLGVDHTVNTSIHYAERKAGRKQFLRWALTSQGVVESPGFPGCSLGFQALEPRLALYNRRIALGGSQINAIPLVGLIDVVTGWLAEDPTALLCNRVDCGRCNAVRTNVAQKSAA
jgi:aminoglycoside 3-N-acetyltransferase